MPQGDRLVRAKKLMGRLRTCRRKVKSKSRILEALICVVRLIATADSYSFFTVLGSSTNQAFPVFQVPYDGEPCMLRLLPLPSCGCRCRTSYFISISWLGMLLSFIHGSIMLHCCLQKRCGTALLQAKCFF